MKKSISNIISLFIVFAPFVASAATTITNGTINSSLTSSATSSSCAPASDLGGLFSYALCLLTYYVTPFLFTLGGVIFIVGVVNYVRAGDNEEKRSQGRDMMWFGIIALFVMLCVWGFVNILSTSIFGGTYGSSLPNLPRQATSVFQQ